MQEKVSISSVLVKRSLVLKHKFIVLLDALIRIGGDGLLGSIVRYGQVSWIAVVCASDIIKKNVRRWEAEGA